MRCLLCKDGEMEKTAENYFAKTKYGYIIIENTPCFKCDDCGEVVYSLSTLENTNKIVKRFDKLQSKIYIVDYKMVA